MLDPRRADIVAGEIIARAQASGLATPCGVTDELDMSEALTRLDAHLCDITELPFRDGLHVFGQAAHDPVSSQAERTTCSGHWTAASCRPAPPARRARGRPDVLPTGRNLSTLDPRSIPTRAAARLGALRRCGGDGPPPSGPWRSSAPHRDGSLGLADAALGRRGHRNALALMGVNPLWDNASTRVTGFSVTPAETRLSARRRHGPDIGRVPRYVSGQIALLDAAARAVAALDEPDD